MYIFNITCVINFGRLIMLDLFLISLGTPHIESKVI